MKVELTPSSRGEIITHGWACKDRVAERVGQIMLAETMALVSDAFVQHGAFHRRLGRALTLAVEIRSVRGDDFLTSLDWDVVV